MGDRNHIFTDSNRRCFRLMERLRPGCQELQVFRNYGHADIFMGKKAHEDIFPRFLRFLEQQRQCQGAGTREAECAT
ncbi:MAG: hypothetical protein U5Q44_01365 [Dehalococcoidia bacterium]|nr:hypothetical protein [Dehalococcoidia bacterium]